MGKPRIEAIRRSRRRRRLFRWLRPLAMLLIVVLYLRFAPSSYNIAEPLDLEAKPTLVTNLKLRIHGIDGCYRALAGAGIQLERLPDEIKGRGCVFEDVARLDQSFVSWGGDITLRCPMLAGLALWELHALQPAARKYFDSEVVRVRHYGTYSCRNINNAASGRRSEHATANAVDVAGFVLADGTEISVLKDWGQSSPKGRFLERVHGEACRRFQTVLGPEYNALHRDHFHFDNGNHQTCR